MNLVTDGVTAVALGLEPPEKDVMRRPPRDPTEPLLNRYSIFLFATLGSYIAIATLIVFYSYMLSGSANAAMVANTTAFTAMVILEKMNVLNFRSSRLPMSQIGYFSNPWLLVAWAGTIGLQVCAVYVPFLQKALHTVPLGVNDWLVIIAVSVPILLVTEAIKRFKATYR